MDFALWQSRSADVTPRLERPARMQAAADSFQGRHDAAVWTLVAVVAKQRTILLRCGSFVTATEAAVSR